jgi:hypothetical protein
MNIFVTSSDPMECAMALDNKRVVKMVLESAQMLCAAMHYYEIKNVPYKLSHKNHPCTKWARQNRSNFKWLLAHFECLLAEYTYRTGKIHKCEELVTQFYESLWYIPPGPLTKFINCAKNNEKGYDYTQIENTYEAYQLYLNNRFKTDKLVPKWTNREKPSWVKGNY